MGVRAIAAVALLSCAIPIGAQVKADGSWVHPDSVRALCIDTEQGIVAIHKAMIETNRKMVGSKDQPAQPDLRAYSDAVKESLVEREQAWNRLGCVHILYGADKKGR